MSEKKSPPHKEKSSSKSLQSESKAAKRKLATPASPSEDDAEKKIQQQQLQQQQQQQKRKRLNVPEGSPEHMGIGSPRGAGATVSRLNVPLSERQQMALLMRMQDESCVGGDVSPKSPPSSGSQVTSSKRTPADKKVNKRNERGEAPLHMAAKKGDYKQTKRLLKAGASVNMKDYAGWTALHEACNTGNLRVARYLLKAGADVNVQGFEDDTPLHDASSNGHRKLVQLLLRHGANPHQPNQKGKTALNVAATSQIEGILRGNTDSGSDIESHSEASSSDSNPSGKEDDNCHLDDGYKSQCLQGKLEAISSAPGPFNLAGTSSSSSTCVGQVGMRRQSVPPSPEKMAASPRLFLKLQHKKSSSSSSSTTDEQQRVSEWNVLTMDTGSELVSELEVSGLLRPAVYDHRNPGLPPRPAARPDPDSWSRMLAQTRRAGDTAAADNDGCPDSTVAPTMSSVIPLERLSTEPFTPHGLEHVHNSDDEEEEGQSDVFSTRNCLTSQQPLPAQQQQRLFQSLHHQQQHNIPVPVSVSTYHNNNTAVSSRHSTNMLHTLTSSTFTSEQSGVSSSSSSSSLHHFSGSSCQFPLVSSSSSSWQQSVCAPTTTTSTSLPFHSYPPAPAAAVRVGTKGGGSIVTGLSDRAVACAVSSVPAALAVVTAAASASQLPSSEGPPLHIEEKSDTSSCDSPLRVDLEDSSSSNNNNNNNLALAAEQGSRPSTPKVPPLKIIIPPKAGGTCANVSKPQGKTALPYVLNPTIESESWDGVLEDGGQRTSTLLPAVLQDGVDYTQPMSRSGFSSNSVLGVSAGNLDVDESASRGSDMQADMQVEGLGERAEEGKEKRPTRTLRSHTAMLQQQKDKTDTKEDCDNCSTTRSQKGDDSTTDDSSFPPRKRKLRNKGDQQQQHHSSSSSTQPASNLATPAAAAAAAKMNHPLEKPPNPYETYLNLRRQIALRHRSLCNVAPKPPSGFKDFLMVNCTYILQGNATSTLSVPMLPPPNLVTEPMREFFIQQEKERYRLRLQHVIEREKLMLSIEQEILREHARAARAMANQTLPFSVCTILREEEIYNQQELEQVEDRDKNVRSRYNGRQFLSWLQDVDDKYEKIKQLLLLRHHHEAESLYAVQKLDWEWKLKECGLCDHKNTPVIDDLHVPMVTVSDEFELLPSS